jgi:hypothetical protein
MMRRVACLTAAMLVAVPAAAQMVGGPETTTAAMQAARDVSDLRFCIASNLYGTRHPELCIGSIATACRADPVACNTREAAAWARLVGEASAEMRLMVVEGSVAFSLAPAGPEAVAMYDASQSAFVAARDTDCAVEAMVWGDADFTLRCRVRHDAGRAISLITRMSP